MPNLIRAFEHRLGEALLGHARVVSALILRDIKTRAGASYFGFLIGMFIPLAHIGVVLIVYILLGRRAPIGTDVTLYLSTAVVPFVVWSYTHQKVMQSFEQNRPLTAFPIVRFSDILLARSIVELLNGILIIFISFSIIFSSVEDFFVANPLPFLYALLLSYLLGVSTGILFGILSVLNQMAYIFGFILIPLYWISSGVFFLAGTLPEKAKMFLYFFPLSHITEFGRVAFYPAYISSYADLLYVHTVIIGNILTGFIVEHFLRPTLTAK